MMLFPLGQHFARPASRRMLRVQVRNRRHFVVAEASLATAAAQESLATAAAQESLATAATAAAQESMATAAALESMATAATAAPQECMATAATAAPQESKATGATPRLDRRRGWLVRGAPCGKASSRCSWSSSHGWISSLPSAIPRSKLKKTFAKHRIKDLSLITYERPHAWVLSEANRYESLSLLRTHKGR